MTKLYDDGVLVWNKYINLPLFQTFSQADKLYILKRFYVQKNQGQVVDRFNGEFFFFVLCYSIVENL